VSGSNQSATVDTTYSQLLTAQVYPAMQGVAVTFAAPQGGAGGTFETGGSTETVVTDSYGLATTVPFTANSTAGSFNVVATTQGLAEVATFALDNTVGAPYSITASAGTPQSADLGAAYSVQLQATVTDEQHNPIAGVEVTFAAPSSGASGSFGASAATQTVATDSAGVATAQTFTANDVAGSFDVKASVAGLSEVATYSLDNLPGAPAILTISEGGSQSAQVSEPFNVPLGVVVTDQYGNALQGVQVTFSGPASGASVSFAGRGSSATATTGSSGVATTAQASANDVAGEYQVTASVEGIEQPAVFSLDNLAGAPYSMAAGVGSSQSAPVGTTFRIPLTVTVTDQYKNPVEGARVTFDAPSNGPSGSFPGGAISATVRTDSSGIAVAPPFSAGSMQGGYLVKASTAGVSQPAVFTLVNSVGSSTSGGYWLAGADGTVYSYGSAGSFGSMGGKALDEPVVGMAATPDGQGYWEVASDGGIFSFGDAHFYGSMGGKALDEPVVGMAATPDGQGYWLVGADGGVFSIGDAPFYGSVPSGGSADDVVSLVPGPAGSGYWVIERPGVVFGFGDATMLGSPAGSGEAASLVGAAGSA
jgi:hypothetical protein